MPAAITRSEMTSVIAATGAVAVTFLETKTTGWAVVQDRFGFLLEGLRGGYGFGLLRERPGCVGQHEDANEQ